VLCALLERPGGLLSAPGLEQIQIVVVVQATYWRRSQLVGVPGQVAVAGEEAAERETLGV
jgi:hypothetical protein